MSSSLSSPTTQWSISLRCAGAFLAFMLASSDAAASDEAPAADSPGRTDVRVTSADDVSLFVRQYGAGDTPIVLLTGGPGYSGDYLEEVAVRLGEQHHALLPDQRGTGRSVINPWDASRITTEASVADVEALRVHAGAEQVVLVGHSWGGVLAMAYASRHGQRVRSLVLIGSGGATSEFTMRYSQNLMARLQPEDMQALFKAQLLMATDPEAATVAMIRAMNPAFILDRELALSSADEYSSPAMLTPAVNIAMQAWLLQYDVTEGLAELDVPVLIVQGQQDPIGEQTARETAEIFSRSEVHLIDDAAHEPFLEQPEAFYAVVEPFLLEHAGEPTKD